MSKKQHVYKGSDVAVSFDSNVCIHAGNCVRELPKVFALGGRPWIQPDRASSAEVVAQVGKCPSGALRVVAELD